MGELRTSRKQRVRLELLELLGRQELTVARETELAGVSLRQVRRLWKRFEAGGDGGVVHRSRGRRSNNRLDDAERAAVLALCRSRYADSP